MLSFRYFKNFRIELLPIVIKLGLDGLFLSVKGLLLLICNEAFQPVDK